MPPSAQRFCYVMRVWHFWINLYNIWCDGFFLSLFYAFSNFLSGHTFHGHVFFSALLSLLSLSFPLMLFLFLLCLSAFPLHYFLLSFFTGQPFPSSSFYEFLFPPSLLSPLSSLLPHLLFSRFVSVPFFGSCSTALFFLLCLSWLSISLSLHLHINVFLYSASFHLFLMDVFFFSPIFLSLLSPPSFLWLFCLLMFSFLPSFNPPLILFCFFLLPFIYWWEKKANSYFISFWYKNTKVWWLKSSILNIGTIHSNHLHADNNMWQRHVINCSSVPLTQH